MRYLNSTGIRIIVFDDDLTNKQIRNLEYIFEENGGDDVKVKLIFENLTNLYYILFKY